MAVPGDSRREEKALEKKSQNTKTCKQKQNDFGNRKQRCNSDMYHGCNPKYLEHHHRLLPDAGLPRPSQPETSCTPLVALGVPKALGFCPPRKLCQGIVGILKMVTVSRRQPHGPDRYGLPSFPNMRSRNLQKVRVMGDGEVGCRHIACRYPVVQDQGERETGSAAASL